MSAAARPGDKASTPADTHGCIACPHSATGPIVSGANSIKINGRPAARKTDKGIHAVCCGTNTFSLIEGSSSVFFEGQPAVRQGDTTQHCGGVGHVIEGSGNVFIGGMSSAGGGSSGSSGMAGNRAAAASASNSGSPAASVNSSSATTTGAAPQLRADPAQSDKAPQEKPDDETEEVTVQAAAAVDKEKRIDGVLVTVSTPMESGSN